MIDASIELADNPFAGIDLDCVEGLIRAIR
jgi:hypothetical protein